MQNTADEVPVWEDGCRRCSALCLAGTWPSQQRAAALGLQRKREGAVQVVMLNRHCRACSERIKPYSSEKDLTVAARSL